jgi:hypothetical protein
MVRTLIPDVSSFIRFHDLDPRTQDQCIYITQKGLRCQFSSSDNSRAKELYVMLSQCQDKSIDGKVLQDYILSNCCKSGRARHCDRIEDVGLLPLLVQRWCGEIVAEIRGRLGSDSVVSDAVNIIESDPLSEFRRHFAERTADDSIICKIQNQLEDRDFEDGSLYVFDRISSPGHVKIGWTAKSVEGRLKAWSKCGYLPNLLFSETSIPFAQRAETLAHYELIDEWRGERMCKANSCRMYHCEWFEVSIERAIRVVGNWAKLFKIAPLYDTQGSLKPYWRSVVRDAIKGGEMVTAHMLLQRLPQTRQDELLPLPRAAASADPMKSESTELVKALLQMDHPKGGNHTPVDSIPIKQESSSMPSNHLSQSLPEPESPLAKLFIIPLRRSKSTLALKKEAVPEDGSQLGFGVLPSLRTETTPVPAILKINSNIDVEEDV